MTSARRGARRLHVDSMHYFLSNATHFQLSIHNAGEIWHCQMKAGDFFIYLFIFPRLHLGLQNLPLLQSQLCLQYLSFIMHHKNIRPWLKIYQRSVFWFWLRKAITHSFKTNTHIQTNSAVKSDSCPPHPSPTITTKIQPSFLCIALCVNSFVSFSFSVPF